MIEFLALVLHSAGSRFKSEGLVSTSQAAEARCAENASALCLAVDPLGIIDAVDPQSLA